MTWDFTLGFSTTTNANTGTSPFYIIRLLIYYVTTIRSLPNLPSSLGFP